MAFSKIDSGYCAKIELLNKKSGSMGEKNLIEQRQEANLRLLEIIQDYLEKYPSLRFGQVLVNLNILEPTDNTAVVKDPYYDEPMAMLDRIKRE